MRPRASLHHREDTKTFPCRRDDRAFAPPHAEPRCGRWVSSGSIAARDPRTTRALGLSTAGVGMARALGLTMAASMRAFAMKSIGVVGFMSKPRPEEPGPTGAIVKTTRALVCTSDTHTVAGAIGPRRDLTLGHEAVGVVHRVGSEVKSIREGDRVAVGAITPCFHCDNCLRGFTSQCTRMLGGWRFANVSDGVFAEYFTVNDAEANLAHIPDDVTDERAVYVCDMMSTGFVGVEHADVPMGGSIAIFAQGPVGLMATAAARLRGAGTIIAVETIPKRKELARHFGADVVIDFKERDAVEAILEITSGDGVDASVEALGAQASFEMCVKATRPGGTISNIGYHGSGEYVSIPRLEWGVGMSDKTIRTALCPGGKVRLRRMLRLLQAGRVDPTPLTTHTFDFGQIDRAFQRMADKADGIIKPLITFD
ncbi:Threonine dehydrogenase [Minicystis rosea]|nr:Threonine dehydrogenase [Minicystis rosea]